jgi:hypothetical protein
VSRERRHALRTALGVAVLAVVWLAGLHIGGLDTGILFLAPAFVLLLPLLAGRYPGERVLAPERARSRRATAFLVSFPRPRPRLAPRGGLLVGCSLAGRAPPA